MAQHYLTYLGHRRLHQLSMLLLAAIMILLTPSSSQQAPVSDTISRILSYRINTPVRLVVDGYKLEQLDLRRLYSGNGYRPLWVSDQGPTVNAISFRRCLEHSYRDGLRPADYHLDAIKKYWNSTTPDRLTELELIMSDVFIDFATDMYQGRVVPQVVDKDWLLEPKPFDPVAILLRASQDDAPCHALFQLRPHQPQYERLRQKLAVYRKIEAAGGWPMIADGDLIKPGMSNDQIPLVRERLRLTGEYTGPRSDSKVLDPDLSEAIKRFQLHHGIYTDGMVGNETREAMSIPVEKCIAQIIVNMERWRWMPRNLGYRYVMVNAAGYELEIVEDGEPSLEMRVVVGKLERPTPVFTSKLQFVDINPEWNVPRTIAVEDILPKLKRDPGFVVREGIQVLKGWGKNEQIVDPYSVDWQFYNDKHLPFHFRQPPGPKNPLGRIRFLFPNPYDIYLHDTNHPNLFDKTERNFSSGCIRVQEPLTLAHYLLRDDSAWNRQKIQQQINSGQSVRIQLGRTLPVYVLYFTSWVDDDGSINFYPDAYGRDKELLYDLGIPTY